MAIGVLWLIVGLTVLALFVRRLWASLPPDPDYRRQLAGWLVALVVATALYCGWLVRHSPRRRPAATPVMPAYGNWPHSR